MERRKVKFNSEFGVCFVHIWKERENRKKYVMFLKRICHIVVKALFSNFYDQRSLLNLSWSISNYLILPFSSCNVLNFGFIFLFFSALLINWFCHFFLGTFNHRKTPKHAPQRLQIIPLRKYHKLKLVWEVQKPICIPILRIYSSNLLGL